MEKAPCKHLEQWNTLLVAKKHECEECVKTGSHWVHLRTCQTCGATLCCDSSPNRHASKHANHDKHPIATSAEPGERWAWCYVDEEMIEY